MRDLGVWESAGRKVVTVESVISIENLAMEVDSAKKSTGL